MLKTRWTTIYAALRDDIMEGTLPPGAKLPIEPALATRFGAGRHSVRRAIAELARDGHVSIEQGRGTFVLSQPMIDYAIGKRTRLRRNLGSQGIDIGGTLLGTDRRLATGRAQVELRLPDGALMIVSRRVTQADGVPVAYGAIYHGADRFPDYPDRRAVFGSVSETYRSYGIEDYVRGRTTIHARPARPDEAETLRQHVSLPVMVVRAVDTLLDGTPISFSEVAWAATRVKFSFVADQGE